MPDDSSPADPSPGQAGWLGFAAKILVTVAVLALIASRVDIAQVAERIGNMAPFPAFLAMLTALLVPAFGGLRWWLVLRAIDRPGHIGRLTSLFSVAMVAGQVMPSVIGDGLRIMLAARDGHRLQAAAHSVLLERASMLATLLLLVLATHQLLIARIDTAGTDWIAPLLLLGGLTGLGLLLFADRAIARLPRLARWRPARLLAELSADTRRCVLSRWGGALLVVGIASNLNFVLLAGLLGAALDLHRSAGDYLASIPLVVFATVLPISLGGWGVREGVLLGLFGAMGAPASGALALSLMYGAFSAIAGLPGTLTWWLRRQPGTTGHRP